MTVDYYRDDGSLIEADGADDGSGHEDGGDCWCEPVRVYVSQRGSDVWVHRGPENRELPPAVLAAVVAELEASESP